MGEPDLKRKIVLLGDSAVGKTSLIRRYVLDSFDDRYITTIGTKITKKEVVVPGQSGNLAVTMMIWDILGQQGYTGTQAMSYVGTQGAIFACDLTRPDSLRSIETYWRPELAKVVGDVPCILVGNKVDLISERKVTDQQLAGMAKALNAHTYLSSAKTGESVEALFGKVAEITVSGDASGTGRPRPASECGPERAREPRNLTDVTDAIIQDFTGAFGDPELAMAMVRKQFSKAGLDISHPTKPALHEAIRLLAEAEHGFKSSAEIQTNLQRRRALVDKCP
jgi:small GTP-binding protein